jgi:hypothetical protein
MSNVLVDVRFTVDVPKERVESLMGRPDDDSEAYWQQAADKAAGWVRDNLADALELAGEPQVET